MKRKILERRKKLLAIAWFLIKFNLLVIPLYVLLYINFSLPSVQTFLANVTARTLQLFGYDVINKGYVLTLSTINQIAMVEISVDCIGWKSIYALFALTLAISYPLKRKIKFLIVALPLLFFINYLRIVSTILFALLYGFRYLEVVDSFLWREGLIIVVLAFWYLWLRQIKYNIGKMKLSFR